MMKTQKNITEGFDFVALTESEMNKVRGGIEPPKSRDKDIYDYDED